MIQQRETQEIITPQYHLQIRLLPKYEELEFLLISKVNNCPLKILSAVLRCEWVKKDPFYLLRIACRFRSLWIQLSLPAITLESFELSLFFKDITSTYSNIYLQKRDEAMNFKMKYWNYIIGKIKMQIILDSSRQLMSFTLLERQEGEVRVGKAVLPKEPFRKKKNSSEYQEKDLSAVFKSIREENNLSIDWQQSRLKINHYLTKQIPISNQIFIKKRKREQTLLFDKIELFRHIFLTELVTHMIINRFRRPKIRTEKYRYGNVNKQYVDEELEELRSWGKRFHLHRDHPIQKQKFEKKKLIQADDDRKKISKSMSKTAVQKQKGKLQRIKQKIQQKERISNFIFISGKEKSRINKERYCLYQMARETDKTEALINFVQLVFETVPIYELIESNKDSKQKKKERMRHFMQELKVRRTMNCLTQYTRESFFHRILNIGLRVLRSPHQLAYLRFPFSHLFWSIKSLYHRHKRAIFTRKPAKNRIIRLYRGCQMKPKEINRIKKKIGGYLEIQGFMSTSLKQSLADSFVVNGKMVIEVPVNNLKGMFDHGFAHLSNLSDHSGERQVIINCFNVFKILSFKSTFDEFQEIFIYTINLEYNSIKQVENKVQKSERYLEAEYKLQVDEKDIADIKSKLEKIGHKMTEKQLEKLQNMLPIEEKKLRNRSMKLKDWEEKEFKLALQKLSIWEKEVIVNTKHQKIYLQQIDNYGELLYYQGDYDGAQRYYRKKIKQIEFCKIIEGEHWRKSFSLLQDSTKAMCCICICNEFLGMLSECLTNRKKLLQLFNSLNEKEESSIYYKLLFQTSITCVLIRGSKSKESKIYQRRLREILEKYDIQNTLQEAILKQMNKKDEKPTTKKQKQQYLKNLKKKIKEKEEKLKEIKINTYGKYSTEYLSQLFKLINFFYQLQDWHKVIKKSKRYLKILKKSPFVGSRTTTCVVFNMMLESYNRTREQKELLFVCQALKLFIRSEIPNHYEILAIIFCFNCCIKWQKAHTCRPVVMKLLKAKVRCKIPESYFQDLMLFSYSLLVLSVSKSYCFEQYFVWIQQLQTEQKYKAKNKHLQHIVAYNEKYNKSSKRTFDQRFKDYEDNIVIMNVYAMINKKKEQALFCKEQKMIDVFEWKNPVYSLQINHQTYKKG